MAILVATIDWDSSADGWTVFGSNPCCTWNASYGETAGGWRWYANSAGSGASCSTYISKTYSWEDLGVPAGSTVTKIKQVDGSTYTEFRCKRSTTFYTASAGQLERQTVVGFVVNTVVIPRTAISGTSWQSKTMTADQSLSDASTVAYSWRLWARAVVPAKVIGNIALYQDSLQLVIEYTPPPTSMKDIIPVAGIIPVPR